jgi:hypothetical protein
MRGPLTGGTDHGEGFSKGPVLSLSGPVCALMRLVGIVTNTVYISQYALKIDVWWIVLNLLRFFCLWIIPMFLWCSGQNYNYCLCLLYGSARTWTQRCWCPWECPSPFSTTSYSATRKIPIGLWRRARKWKVSCTCSDAESTYRRLFSDFIILFLILIWSLGRGFTL